MIDLGYRQTEIGEALLLFQGFLQLLLHRFQMPLGKAQFIGDLAGPDNTLWIVGLAGKGLHVDRHAADRADHQGVDGHKDQPCGEE